MPKNILVVDLGGQYAHLIANRVRRLGAFSELVQPEDPIEVFQAAAGIILSGSGSSVDDLNEAGVRRTNPNHKILELGIPILGLCYGHQWLSTELGGKVSRAQYKEYGETIVHFDTTCSLFSFLQDKTSLKLWMSHADEVSQAPPGFKTVGHTNSCRNAAISNEEKKIFGLQFHPEVTHSERGQDIIGAFVKLCDHEKWQVSNFVEHISPVITAQVADRKVFMLVSGGVDSSVAFTLLNKILGPERVTGVLVDTGLMRKDEVKKVMNAFQALGVTNLQVEDASELFLSSLKEIYEPEAKRKVIGQLFLQIKDEVSTRLNLNPQEWLLGQGTIYPDTIETGGTKHSSKIKTHHNRIDQITELIQKGLVVEPLKELYKDEVRDVGRLLQLPDHLVDRHPFPGPGLGVRVLCVEEEEHFEGVEALEVKIETYLKEFQLQEENKPIFERVSLSVLVPPIKSVGVQGDNRSYKHPVIAFLKGIEDRKEEFLSETIVRFFNELTHRFEEINRALICVSHTEAQFKGLCAEKNLHKFNFQVKKKSYLSHDRVEILRQVDAIVGTQLRSLDLYSQIWQFPVVLLPLAHTLPNESIVLRPVSSMEAMTARPFILPENCLKTIVDEIKKESSIDFIFYDVTTKPPATIEFE